MVCSYAAVEHRQQQDHQDSEAGAICPNTSAGVELILQEQYCDNNFIIAATGPEPAKAPFQLAEVC